MKTALIVFLACASVWAQFEVSLGVKPGQLKFEVEQFEVPPNAEIKLTFLNNGIMPHNLVVCERGKAEAVVKAASQMNPSTAAAKGWVPDTADILAKTPLVEGGNKASITFTSPKTPGEYTFLCCYPGHWFVMRGTMAVVVGTPKAVRSNVELNAGEALAVSTVQPKPVGSLGKPFIIRTFMPDPDLAPEVFQFHQEGHPASRYSPSAGKDVDGTVNPISGLPAAIGVSHGPVLAYCWDTVECKLLYAWNGGFMDMTRYWGAGTGGGRKGFGYVPDLEGNVFYKTSTAGPLETEKVHFRGFRLDKGIPVFRYKRGGFDIEERIEPAGERMLQSFRLNTPKTTATEARFAFTNAEREMITPSTGTWEGDTLVVPIHGSAFVALEWKIPPPPPPPPPPEPVHVKSADGVLKSIFRKGNDKQAELAKGGLKNGGRVYADREYTYQNVPERLAGIDVVQTFNEDKQGAAGTYSFELAKPGRIIVLYDERFGDGTPILKGRAKVEFRATGETVGTDGNWAFRVIEANVPAGTYSFGAQIGNSHLTFTAVAPSTATAPAKKGDEK